MSFTLNLGFGGLCLFVPDYDMSAKPIMHVLLPAGHNHRGFLAHDLSALIGGPPTLQVLEHSLTNTRVDLSALVTSTALQPPPQSVANLKDLCSPVPRRLLDDAGSELDITSRITFAAGDSTIDYCASGAFWEFGGVRQLPIRVVWSCEIDASELVVEVVGHSSPSKTITLEPYEDVLDLWAFHLDISNGVDTLPPLTKTAHPKYDEPAAHFCAFLDLLGCSAGPVPMFRRPEFIPGHFPSCYDPSAPGLDVTCVGATAPAVPR